MRVEAIIPDIAAPTGPVQSSAGNGFAALVDAAGSQLDRADAAESAYAHGQGGLQEMVLERARADIALQVAATGAQRASQALNTLLGMQI
jgi:hypothetical protein